jgi:hypothetical protein
MNIHADNDNTGFQLYSMARYTITDAVIPGVSRNLLNGEYVNTLRRFRHSGRNDSL